MSAPSTSTHLSQLAFQLSQEGLHDQAMDLLKRAHQSEPGNPYLAVNLALCALAGGHSQEASPALEQAEALFSLDQLRSFSVLERLSNAWLLALQPERARSLLEQHAPLVPESGDPELVLHASVVTALDDSDQALALWSRLQDPLHRDVISAPLSSLLIRQGRLQEAETVLVQSPGTSTRPDLMTNLAIIASELGKVSRARSFYMQAVELEPQSFVPAYNLSRFLFLQGDLEMAQTTLLQALQITPHAREGYQLLEQIESRRGDFAAALSVISRWRKLDNNDLAAQIAECRVYVALGREDELTTSLHTLVSRCPGHPELLSLLAGLPTLMRSSQGLSPAVARCFQPEHQVRHHHSVLPDQLCDQLQDLILAHPTLHALRPNKPSRHGAQTHELFTEPLAEPLDSLTALLRPLLETMISTFDVEQCQALAYPNSMQRLAFSGWGVVLESGGYQAPHGHPESLFSGVAYLQVPKSLQVVSAAHASGSVCFYGDGVRDVSGLDSSSQAHELATMSILPDRGDIILFPSYLWHGTVPFEGDQQRICLAFNVFPRMDVAPCRG